GVEIDPARPQKPVVPPDRTRGIAHAVQPRARFAEQLDPLHVAAALLRPAQAIVAGLGRAHATAQIDPGLGRGELRPCGLDYGHLAARLDDLGTAVVAQPVGGDPLPVASDRRVAFELDNI